MQRREFLIGLGAAAALASTTQAFADDKPASGASDMHPAMYAGVQRAAAHCVSAGDDCLRHCFGMLSMNDTSMMGCTKASYEMVAACNALATLAAANSPHVPALAKVVATICADCKKQCDKYPNIPECKACAETCANTISECEKLAA